MTTHFYTNESFVMTIWFRSRPPIFIIGSNLKRKCDKFILHFPLGNFATKKSNNNYKLRWPVANEMSTYQQSGWWTIDQLVDHQQNQHPTWLKHNSRLGQFAFDQRFRLNIRSDESLRGQMSHLGWNEVERILPVQAMIRQLRTPAQNPTIIA